MKVEKYCWSCDTEFKVTAKTTDRVTHCPFCGSEFEPEADTNLVDDEEELE